jgi:tryptophan 2,3-dioxygenase
MTVPPAKPRRFAPLTEADRQDRYTSSGGSPVIESSDDTTPYIEYQSIDQLLALQHPRSDEPAEWTFYVLGQVMELLFKLIHHELVTVREHLAVADVEAALRVLRRLDRTQTLLEDCWGPLEAISPAEFNNFRDQLGSASGLGSYMFRQVEFVLGNKSAALGRMHEQTSAADGVRTAFIQPSVWDAAHRTLAAHGFPVAAAILDRDPTSDYIPDAGVEAAWAAVYRSPAEHPRLHALAEALSLLAHRHHRWRSVHILIAERILGNKPGTGATAGVAWLQQAAQGRLFPELLSCRSLL